MQSLNRLVTTEARGVMEARSHRRADIPVSQACSNPEALGNAGNTLGLGFRVFYNRDVQGLIRNR